MADPDLQALLDPGLTGNGITILRREGGASDTLTQYYVTGGALRGGRARWVAVTRSDSDATKDTAIRNNLLNP